MITDMLCNKNNTLLQTIKIIDNNAKRIVFIVNDQNQLLGTVTDGDIRRAILRGVNLEESVECILSASFVYSHIKSSHDDNMRKVSDKVRIFPLVDDDKKVVDFFEYNTKFHFPVAMPNLQGKELQYLIDAFLSTWISSSGVYIGRFESGFAEYSDSEFGVAVSNGTVALHLALIALGIGEGDEVIIPDLTFAATINTVLHANATPVIVDIQENSWCIDPKEIESAITPKTKAIIPVHIYGQVCDMDKIIDIAEKYNLKIIEDCAEAHGAVYKGKKVGSFGDIGCFSFYGNKIITTGEGGMCVTNNSTLDNIMRKLRDHGMSKTKRYWHDVVGYNYRMTNLQAAIGLAQLERIDEILCNRKKYEELYLKVLNDKHIIPQKDLANCERVIWITSFLIEASVNKDLYIEKLTEKGIDVRPFFYPLSSMQIYKGYCKKKTSISKKISERGINLPTYSDISHVKKIYELFA